LLNSWVGLWSGRRLAASYGRGSDGMRDLGVARYNRSLAR
jgi:hypothetical protein